MLNREVSLWKNLAFVMIYILLISLVSGCSHQKNGKSPTLTFLTFGSPEQLEAFRKVVASFEDEHPGIKVNMVTTVHYQLSSKLMIMISAGTSPDITMMLSSDVADFAERGTLEKLDHYINRKGEFNRKDYFELPFKGFTWQGDLYALPRRFNVSILAYNKTLFDEEGIDYPNKNWTWDDYLKAAQRLTKDTDKDGHIDQFGCSNSAQWPDVPWIYQNGGKILSEDGKRCMLAEPPAYEALQFLRDLAWKYRVAPITGEELTGMRIEQAFAMGRIAMIPTHSGLIAEFRKSIKKFIWDVSHLPQGKAGKSSGMIATGYSICKQSRNKEMAWKFVRFTSGPAAQKIEARIPTAIPTIKSVARSSIYVDPNKPPRNMKVFFDILDYAYPRVVFPKNREKINSIVGSELDLLWLNKRSAKETCEVIASKVDKLLQDK